MPSISNVFDTVTAFDTLLAAYRLARRGKRYREYVASFDYQLTSNLLQLQRELRTGSYKLAPYRHFVLRESKERQVDAPAFRDRIVQHAICSQLGSFYERQFINDSYACRPSRGTHRAVRRIQHFLRSAPPRVYMSASWTFLNITLP